MTAKKMTAILLALLACGLVLTGCSDDSESPLAVDTAPPAVPTGLTASEYSRGVTVRWEPNTMDADFLGFKVYMTCGANTVSLVADPQPNNWFVHSDPVAGYMNTFLVTSVDYSGNESAPARLDFYVDADREFTVDY